LTQRSRSAVAVTLATLSLVGNLACSKAPGDDAPSGAALPHFHDVLTAPAPIRTAARAVVRVSTAGDLATGSFVSPSGLLLTNNHVLGVEVCPREGCWMRITFLHQRGEPSQGYQPVFGVPVAVDVGLDLAFVQLYWSPGGLQLDTPDHLTIRSETPASLLGLHVTVVGHPEGSLKKWTDGVVAYWSGDWFESTAYTLPGSSGSPVLDDSGQLVGVVHRGPTGEDLITSDTVNVYSLGTASASILSAELAPLPAVMVSAAAPTTADDAVSNERLYLNARYPTVSVSGVYTSVLSLLGAACDAALARTDYVSPGDLASGLAPCYAATYWIDCRPEAGPASYQPVCPSAPDLTAWSARFLSMNAIQRKMNGAMDLYAVSFAIAHLETSTSAGYAAGAAALQQALDDAQPELDFTLATYLAAFEVTPYAGRDVAAFVSGYRSVPHYQLEATSIASAVAWLAYHGALSRTQLLALLSALHEDPSVAVGAKLYVEELQYGYGAL
jgi:hypothetical protein